MTLQILFLLIAAFAVFIIVPIALLLTAIAHFRHKASDRPTGGPIPIGVICGQMPSSSVPYASSVVKTAATPILTLLPNLW
jgi:hypothetical protein